jgi:hypothetical protein
VRRFKVAWGVTPGQYRTTVGLRRR